MLALFRVRTVDNIIWTLGQLQKLNPEDREYFIKYVEGILSINSEEYK